MDIKRLPKTEFAAAVAQIAGERNIDVQSIIDSIELGLISAYKRDQKEHGIIVPEDAKFEVELAPENGSFKIYQLDGEKKSDVTPPGFGRIAAQTAKQVIDQKIHEAEHSSVVAEYEKKIGSIIPGIILRIDPHKITVGIGKTEGILPRDEQIRNEILALGTKKLFLIQKISRDPETDRSDIVLSRRDPDFIAGLFTREVPEVSNGAVIIEKIARTAGERTKVAVSSGQAGVDPVGSCIGKNGTRIQSILNEIPQSEKLDVVAYSTNKKNYIVQALSPAQGVEIVSLKDQIAVVTVPENQLALAIGAGGENVRLAGVLTDVEIKVQAAEK